MPVAVLPRLQQHGVDVAFEVVDGDQWLFQGKRQRLGVAQANQQRAGESGPPGHRERVDACHGEPRLLDRLAHDRNNRPQVFARGELGNHSAVGPVSQHLREHYV